MDRIFQNITDFRRRFFAIPPLSAILVIFVFFAGALSARVNTDVERELDNTDLVIERVQDIFPDEPTQVMIDNFELAVSMQTDAREAFAEDDQMLALSLTRQAREIALRLERIILAAGYKPPEGPPNAILRVLEQNDELIEELTPSVDEFGDAIIRRDFAAYIDMHISAWNFYNDENFPVSGQLAQVARDRFLQIRRALIEAARLFSPEKIQSELDKARELVHETERGLFPEAFEAVELHDMALELLAEAELMFANARPREAMRLIDEVVVLSRRSSEIARRGGLSTGRLEEEIARTEAIIAEATQNLADGSRPEAMEISAEAASLLEEARTSFQNGDTESAERLVIEARRTADLAVRSAAETGDINRWNVEKGLINIDKIIERIATPVEESGSREAKELHARAIELQGKARILFDDENYKEALSTSRAAADAANQALKIIER